MTGGFIGACQKSISHKGKKMEYRRTPTFVNLKSNTMKNTLQRY